MAPFWFLTGAFFTLTGIVLLLPWLRNFSGVASPSTLPWPAKAGALLAMAAVLCLLRWVGAAQSTAGSRAVAADTAAKTAPASDQTANSWNDIANAMGSGPGGMTGRPSTKPGAEPMTAAIASLHRRLARGGGSAADWELLAKSYEFLGLAAEASKVRAHQLPPLPTDDGGSADAAAPETSAPGSVAVVSGEVSLAAELKAKVPPGATLFIVAKSVELPGPPVAVFRTKVGSWPLKFELNDSQSMLPGRNLSNAGRVTVQARISRSGQPLPAPGDLQGSTDAINPADHLPQQIVIREVIR